MMGNSNEQKQHRHSHFVRLELVLSLDTNGHPSGKDSIVWATYDLRQAEIIRNALLTQRISCGQREMKLDGKMLHLLHVADEGELNEAMDFIWRDSSGLRLKPDWKYPEGTVNKSLEGWLSGL